MDSPVNMHSFCHMCVSPPHPHSQHHHHHNHHNHDHLPNVDYPRCLEMRMNMDYSGSRSSSSYDVTEGYPNSPYPRSPQSRSSCMYSLHAKSPPIVHSLALKSPDQFMSPSKENGLYREIPQCRRRLDFNHNEFLGLSKAVPVTVAKRNERERNRVKLINTTFQTLRQHLPVQNRGAKGQAKKLSKVQTLRSAIEYIRKLEDLVEERKDLKQSQSKEHNDNNNINIDNKLDSYDNDGGNKRGFANERIADVAKQYQTINNNFHPSINNSDVDSPSKDSHYHRTGGSPADHEDFPNDIPRSSDELVAFHRSQHYSPRAYCHQKNCIPQHGRPASLEGVGHRFGNTSAGSSVKPHSEGGSASPADSDHSGDVTAAEEDEFFDFDLWF